MAATKKNQLLLVSSTSQPNLLCFGFDLTQSQSSKTVSRNGYGPNWNRTNFNWRDQEMDMVPERECTAHQQKLYTRCFKMRLGEKLKRGVLRRYRERQAWNRGERGTIYLLLQPLKFLFYFLFFVSFSALGKQNLENRIWAFFITLW